MTRAPVRARAALAFLAAAVFAALVARLARWTVDDAYITLRYARELARGAGLTFNPSGPRAEGYTSLLWTVLLALPHLVHADALAFAKVAGVAATFGTFAILWRESERLSRAEGGAGWAAPAAALALAAIPATAVHAVSGMETALFTLLLTATFAAAAAAVGPPAAQPGARLPLFALALSLTRPEGALAAALVLATVAALAPAPERSGHLKRAIALVLLPFAAYWAARTAYYGLPFPLPFYVKLAHPGRFPGAPVVGQWLREHGLRLGLALLFAFARPPRALWPAILATAALTAFFLLPQHLMGYQHRYLAPLDPALCLFAGLGLDRAVRAFARRVPRARGLATPLALLLVLGASAAELADARIDVHERLAYADGMAAAHETLGRALSRVRPAGRLALADAGAVPYLSDWWTLDLIGLNDARIATSRDRSPAAVLAQRPDVVVLVSREAGRFVAWNWNPWETPLQRVLERDAWTRVRVLRFGPDYWLWVYTRPAFANPVVP